jgi:integrase
VLSDAIASVPIDKLAARHVKEWRKRLAETPAARPKRGKKCRVKTPPPPPKPRSGMAINRDMVALRAALNLALRDNYVVTDAAWREALKPIEGANERRTAYLSLDQRRELVKQVAHDDLRQFVRGMCLLPLRPGALAALTVANFDSRSGALTVKTDKAGAGRVILLPTTAADLLRECAKGKLPAAPLFARWDGSAWHRDAWKKGIGAAAAKIGAKATAYTLRHSVITDLVVDQALDLFTVAALSGTSVVMIEKHYGHLRQDRAQQALAGLAL